MLLEPGIELGDSALGPSSEPLWCPVSASQTKEDQIQVIGNLKNISMASSKLLLAAKSLSVDPGAPNAKNLLAAAAR